MKNYRSALLFTGIVLLLASGAALYHDRILGCIALGISLVLMGGLLLLLSGVAHKQQKLMDQVFADNGTAAAQLISHITIPLLLSDMSGRIVWRNEAMAHLYPSDTLKEALPAFNPAQPAVQQIVWQGSSYQVMTMAVNRPHARRRLLLQFWLDRTEAAHYQRLYTEQLPCVMLVYVDNYEDMAGDRQFHGTAVLAEVERLISDTIRNAGGVYCRYENGRFLCFLEAQALKKLESDGFRLIEQARRIETGTGSTVSLSIAVGMAQRVAQSEESARLAMELALGRGGDQAVVRDGADYRFYGGRKQQDARQSRVKMRLFAKALRQLFENNGDVFIMGHRNPDMDCLGAALGVATCAEHTGSRAFIVLEEGNPSIEEYLNEMRRTGLYNKLILTRQQAKDLFRDNSVLVVVDTQRPSTVEAPDLLHLAEHLVLIDHHRRSADYIENPTLHYLESRSSSTCEMVTEVLQYFAEGVRPNAFVCSTLLAGISLDTKQFAFNVGSRTFEAAGFLRRNGADLSAVSSIFQNDFDRFVAVSKVVEHANIDENGIAVSCCPEDGSFNKLTAAQAADELLTIRGVKASFVLGRGDEEISISGRSLGGINVQLILERLGGGGHLTMAGAQLTGVSMEEAVEKLRESITEQLYRDNEEKLS